MLTCHVQQQLGIPLEQQLFEGVAISICMNDCMTCCVMATHFTSKMDPNTKGINSNSQGTLGHLSGMLSVCLNMQPKCELLLLYSDTLQTQATRHGRHSRGAAPHMLHSNTPSPLHITQSGESDVAGHVARSCAVQLLPGAHKLAAAAQVGAGLHAAALDQRRQQLLPPHHLHAAEPSNQTNEISARITGSQSAC